MASRKSIVGLVGRQRFSRPSNTPSSRAPAPADAVSYHAVHGTKCSLLPRKQRSALNFCLHSAVAPLALLVAFVLVVLRLVAPLILPDSPTVDQIWGARTSGLSSALDPRALSGISWWRRYHESSHPHTFSTVHPVCLIGNAGAMQGVERVFDMWGGQFPAVYYSWREDAQPAVKSPVGDVWMVSDREGGSFRHGVHYALMEAKARYNCQYFFLHDDDLTFQFNPDFTSHENKNQTAATLPLELVSILQEYQPLYATFLWEAGLKNEGFNQTFHLHRRERAYPYTAGDSGMTLYHHRIVDFFIPFSPYGEGGFIGNWTLPTHFLDLFAGTAMEGIVINTIRYQNNINPDNHAAANWTITDDGFAVNAVSRHKYEWPQNGAYLKFLYSSVRVFDTPQARARVTHTKIPSAAERLQLSNEMSRTLRSGLLADAANRNLPFVEHGASSDLVEPSSWDVDMIVRRVMSVVDPRHPALASSEYMKRPEAQAVVQTLVPITPVDLRVSILTFRRFDNALELLSRLAKELKEERGFAVDHFTVSVHILCDYDKDTKDEARDDLLRKAKSLLPAVHVDIAKAHRGLTKTWLESWYPSHMDSFHLILEDDLDISPSVLRSTVTLIRSVYYGIDYPFDKILGISLFNEQNSDVALAVSESTAALIQSSGTLRQSISSWGAVMAAPGWRQFVTWKKKLGPDFDPLLKDSLSNRWPTSESWKKYALRFAAEHDMFMYYPQFPNQRSLVRKLSLRGGTNDKGNLKDVHSELELTNTISDRAFDIRTVPRLDYKLDPLPSPPQVPSFRSFDGCTLVMPLCYRLEVVPMLLQHYASVPFAAQIILVQQPCVEGGKPLEVPERIGNVPIVLKRMETNDMNNRYIDFEEIKYDCVINLDDDLMHPHEAMLNLVRLWRTHFFDYYVGWFPNARIHLFENGKYEYHNHSWVVDYGGVSSMLLPSGSVFHRKFLTAYNADANKAARDVVSDVINCDDVLMNFVIANASNHGPVVLDDWSSLKRSEKLRALSENVNNAQWMHKDHMNKRSYCIDKFTKIYGKMPLRYSTVMYKSDKSVPHYPRRVQKQGVPVYLFSGLVPNRNTMLDVPDLCNDTTVETWQRKAACPQGGVR